jgi:hypothetical protein
MATGNGRKYGYLVCTAKPFSAVIVYLNATITKSGNVTIFSEIMIRIHSSITNILCLTNIGTFEDYSFNSNVIDSSFLDI